MLALGIVMMVVGIIGGFWALPPRPGYGGRHVMVAWFCGALVSGGATALIYLALS